ncbi:MAG TPA: FliA/WhiG family RNA polymerase sigma factor [Longimicrobiales bacterium]|nr:FliA/WhiG family RNA polymerase sigma factor [Longimicrobiales bacterium]
MEHGSLWEQYRRRRDPAICDELVRRHLPLVHHIARRMLRPGQDGPELDDLVGAGTIGLIDAIERYDPDRGIAFSTFAAPRIRGAILDDLRRWDQTSRLVRRRQRAVAAARNTLAATLEREPSDHETARAIGIQVEELWRWQLAEHEATPVSIYERVERARGRSATRAELVADTSADPIEDRITESEILAIVQDEIARLPERERIVLSLYYFEELKLHEIGAVLDITESRVSQIRTKALNTLRQRLAHLRS